MKIFGDIDWNKATAMIGGISFSGITASIILENAAKVFVILVVAPVGGMISLWMRDFYNYKLRPRLFKGKKSE